MLKSDYLERRQKQIENDSAVTSTFSESNNKTLNHHSLIGSYASSSTSSSAYNQAYFNFQNHSNAAFQLNHDTSNATNEFYQNPFLMYSNNYGYQNGQFPQKRTSTGSTSPSDSSSPSLISPNIPREDANTSHSQYLSANLPQVASSLETDQEKSSSSSALFPNFKKYLIASSNATTPAYEEHTSSSEDSLPFKKRRPVPCDLKDSQYWEKRKKNNESAKRSRENKKSKEEHISLRVIYLEQENLQLRTECSLLRNEVEKLRSIIYQSNKFSQQFNLNK